MSFEYIFWNIKPIADAVSEWLEPEKPFSKDVDVSIHPSMAYVGTKVPQKTREQLWETAQFFDLWDGYYVLQEHYCWAEANSWKIWAQILYAQTCPLPPSTDKPQKHPVTQVRAAETSFPSPVPSPCARPAVLLWHMWVAHQNVTESEFISIWCSWDNISNPSLS